MKCNSTNCILTFVLAALAVAGVIFALKTIFLTREFRSLTSRANQAQTSLLQAQSLANDVVLYNQKNPSLELTKSLQAIQVKSAAR
jgi:hypothetical protein